MSIPNMSGHSSNLVREGLNGTEGWTKVEFASCLTELRHLPSPGHGVPCSQDFTLASTSDPVLRP